jgi:hypothetical protein
MGHIAVGVSSMLASFVSNRSSAFFRVMRLIDFETKLTVFVIYLLLQGESDDGSLH